MSIALRAAASDRSVNAPTVLPREIVLTVIESPSFTPTWKVTEPAPDRRLMPLNLAEPPMRSISDASWLTSVWIAAWSSLLSVPFLYCTASSRTRWSMEWTSSRFPSAVCTIETPSWMLRFAWARPLICERMRSEIERPAASSAARLMR